MVLEALNQSATSQKDTPFYFLFSLIHYSAMKLDSLVGTWESFSYLQGGSTFKYVHYLFLIFFWCVQ